MLSAHTGHLIHPEYLQPLTPASVTIELDAKKSPLALLAQTCLQIGKADPRASSKESATPSGLKLGEQRPSSADKCSFKSYHKVGGGTGGGSRTSSGGDNEVSSSSFSDKAGFRVFGGTHGNTSNSPLDAPHPFSPSCGEQVSTQQSIGMPPNPLGTSPNSDLETRSPSSTSSDCGGGGVQSKEDTDAIMPNSKGPHLANSGHTRTSTNCSTGSSDGGNADCGPGCLTPISPYKAAHPLFPLPPSNVVYHSSVVGTYAGYPPRLGPKHPSSSPLTGALPPFCMQGMCRDPYCLNYPSIPHLSSGPCVQEPSSLKSSFPLVYTAHPPHPLYSYILPSDSNPHAYNWELVRAPSARNALVIQADPKVASLAPAPCHQHPSHICGSGCSVGVPHSLGLARYHPYLNKVRLPTGPSAMSLQSLPTTSSCYPHYAFYNQRLGPPSTLGYYH